MTQRIFLAGATGAVGARLVPLLVRADYTVFGTTRSPQKLKALEDEGVEALLVDVFDAQDLSRAVKHARPDTVIHQLTDLPPGLDPARMAEAVPRNARIRKEGTANLVAAALAAGARRLVSQSIAWVEKASGATLEGVQALERLTLGSPPLAGIVLRYGQLYGPGTGNDAPRGDRPLHVDAAASAALFAVMKGTPGIYVLAEPNPHVDCDKARRELGWDPYFRLPSGTK